MNTTVTVDEIHNGNQEKPGLFLAGIREKRGFSQEYVAGKLHLRVRVIELLEADDYEQMPEPVFIKGYLRAYAKLVGTPPDPLLAMFNAICTTSERKLEKALWQGKRESNRSERAVRLLTGVITITAIIAVGIWWQKTKDSQQQVASNDSAVVAEASNPKVDSEIRLTDLSKMSSVLTPNDNPMVPMEISGG